MRINESVGARTTVAPVVGTAELCTQGLDPLPVNFSWMSTSYSQFRRQEPRLPIWHCEETPIVNRQAPKIVFCSQQAIMHWSFVAAIRYLARSPRGCTLKGQKFTQHENSEVVDTFNSPLLCLLTRTPRLAVWLFSWLLLLKTKKSSKDSSHDFFWTPLVNAHTSRPRAYWILCVWSNGSFNSNKIPTLTQWCLTLGCTETTFVRN